MSESRITVTRKWSNSRCQFTKADYPHRQCIAAAGHSGPHRDLSGPIETEDEEE